MRHSARAAFVAAALAVTFALGLVWAPGPALALRGENPMSRVNVRDQMRCDALTKQFHAASAHRMLDDAAKQAQEQASQGEVLCRAGRYDEGADTLEKAVRMLGEVPGK